MKFFAGFLVIMAVFAMISALPPKHRIPIANLQQPAELEAESILRAQRQAEGGHHHHDAVDFGAHTGDHGAFGWYADFPVHGH